MAKIIRFTAKSGKITEHVLAQGSAVLQAVHGAKVELIDTATGKSIPLKHVAGNIIKFLDDGTEHEVRLNFVSEANAASADASESSNSSSLAADSQGQGGSGEAEGSTEEHHHGSNKLLFGLLGLGGLAGGIAAAAGGKSDQAPKDTTPPVAPSIALASDTGSSPTDKVTSSGAVNVTGLETGASWQYSTDGGTNWVSGSGSSFTLSGDGAKSVLVRQTDAAGNVGPNSSALAFTLDSTAPAAPVVALESDTGSSGADHVTRSGVVNVSGIEAGASWQYSTNGGTSWTDGSGSSFTLAGDGAKSVVVRAIDVAGNSTSTTLDFTLDTTAPTATIALGDNALVTGETTTATITFSEAVTGFTLADLVYDHAAVALSNLSAPTTNQDGSVTYTVAVTPLAGIEDATNTISLAAASYADVAGNNGGAAASANFTVDTLQTVNIGVAAGPFIKGTFTVDVYGASGRLLTIAANGSVTNAVAGGLGASATIADVLTSSSDPAAGAITLNLPNYAGPLFFVLNDSNGAGNNFYDVVEGAVDLGTALRAYSTVPAGGTVNVSITPFTEAGVRLAEGAMGHSFNNLTGASAADLNALATARDAFFEMIGLPGLASTLPVSANQAGFNANTPAGNYGEALASFSGYANALSGGNGSGDIDAALNAFGHTISPTADGSGTVSLALDRAQVAIDISLIEQGLNNLSNALDQEIAARIAAVAGLQGQIDGLRLYVDAQDAALSDRIDALQADLEQHVLDLTAYIDQQIAAVQADVNGEIADRIAAVNNLQDQIDALSLHVDAADQTLQNNIDAVQSNLDQAVIDLTAYIDQQIADLQGQINTHSGLISDLTDRVTSLEGAVTALQANDLVQDGLIQGLRSDLNALQASLDALAPNPGGLEFYRLNDSGSNNEWPVTTDATFRVVLSGNEDGTTVMMQVRHATVIGDLAAAAWTDLGTVDPATSSIAQNVASSGDGIYQYRAVITGANNNVAYTPTLTMELDTTASPADIVIDDVTADNVVNITEAAGALYLTGKVTDPNAETLTLTFDSDPTTPYTVEINDDGTWQLQIDGHVGGFGQGPETVTISYTDTAGNASGDQTHTFSVDTIAPTLTIDNMAAQLYGAVINGSEDNDVLVSGTSDAEDGQIVTVTFTDGGGNTVEVTATVTGGIWALTGTDLADISGLDNGTIAITANVSDAAGNSATEATDSVSLDNIAPTISIDDPITAVYGPVAADNFINNDEAVAFTVSGTTDAEDGQVVTVVLTDSTNPANTATVTATVAGGVWTTTATNISTWTPGAVNITANVEDAAGNAATEATAAPELTTLAAPTITSAIYDNTANTLTIAGTNLNPDAGNPNITHNDQQFYWAFNSSLDVDGNLVNGRTFSGAELTGLAALTDTGGVLGVAQSAENNLVANSDFAGNDAPGHDDYIYLGGGYLSDVYGNSSPASIMTGLTANTVPITFHWTVDALHPDFVGGSGNDIIIGSNAVNDLTGGLGGDDINLGVDAVVDTVNYVTTNDTDHRTAAFFAGGSTADMDVLSNFGKGDLITISGNPFTAATVSLTYLTDATANQAAIVQGTLVEGIFTAGAGDDYVVQWSDGTEVHSVVIQDYGLTAPSLVVDDAADTLTLADKNTYVIAVRNSEIWIDVNDDGVRGVGESLLIDSSNAPGFQLDNASDGTTTVDAAVDGVTVKIYDETSSSLPEVPGPGGGILDMNHFNSDDKIQVLVNSLAESVIGTGVVLTSVHRASSFVPSSSHWHYRTGSSNEYRVLASFPNGGGGNNIHIRVSRYTATTSTSWVNINSYNLANHIGGGVVNVEYVPPVI